MNSELKQDFRTVRCEDADYPRPLKELADRPSVLYVKGKWPLSEDRLTIGIVGSRQASPYGLDATRQLTIDLVRKGVVTVSGLAAGVDAGAHRATLKEKGWTVAVLGHGFGYRYPKVNTALFSEIEQEGTLITEFPYDAPPLSTHFPQRNRIISGLSRGVLVVEAGSHSGALITARCAAEQGRDVFVVPGSIFSWQSRGCHILIKEGARLIETAEEVMGEYGFSSPGSASIPMADDLTITEVEILNLLNSAPLTIDELVELSGQSFDRLAEVLLALELKGRIQSVPGQRYATRH